MKNLLNYIFLIPVTLILIYCNTTTKNKTTSNEIKKTLGNPVYYKNESLNTHLKLGLNIDDNKEISVEYSPFGKPSGEENILSSSEYQVLPINGIVGGITGNPYYIVELISDGSNEWPLDTSSNRTRAEITAKWGYAAVPEQNCGLGRRVHRLQYAGKQGRVHLVRWAKLREPQRRRRRGGGACRGGRQGY